MTNMDFEMSSEKKAPSLSEKITLFCVSLKGIWHKKRYVMASMWLFSLLGWTAISLLPNQYETTTQFVADTRSILKPLLEGIAVQSNPEEEIRIVSQTLLSRPNLEDIAQKADLHLLVHDDSAYESMLKKLKEKIIIKGTPGTNLYSISYRHQNPETAKRVIELTLKKFIDTLSTQSRTDTVSAKTFLDKKINEYNDRLADSEEKLATFKRLNQHHLPSRGRDYYHELADVTRSIEETQLTIKELSARIEGLKARFIPSSDGPGGRSEAVVPTQYDEAVQTLEMEVSRLQLTYTQAHPLVQESQGQLDMLKRKQKAARDSMVSQASRGQMTSGGRETMTAMQEFALELSKLESERDAMKARLDALSEKQSRLDANLDLIPDIERQLSSLTRDYDNDKKYYTELLKRRDSAEITGSADSDTRAIKFQVIEPPMRAIKPVGPPRIAMYVVTFLLSIAIGITIAFSVSLINPTVINMAHLEQLVGKDAIIGQLPDTQCEAHRRHAWLKSLIFVTSTLLLFAALCLLLGHEIVYDQSPLMWLK